MHHVHTFNADSIIVKCTGDVPDPSLIRTQLKGLKDLKDSAKNSVIHTLTAKH